MLNKVFIEIEGGTLQGIYTDVPTMFYLIDWDSIKRGGSAEFYPSNSIASMPEDTRKEIIKILEIKS